MDLTKVSGPLTLWSHYEIGDTEKALIRSRYPDVDITYKTIPADKAVHAYLQSFAEDSVDLFILKGSWLGHFSEIDLFEDLSKAPYFADPLLDEFPGPLRSSYRSFDEQKLLALPLAVDPMVTFYRYDVFEQANLPSRPEDLADYMVDHANWLHAAKSLKSGNQWIIPWVSEPLTLVTAGSTFFDKNMNYSFDRNQLVNALETGWEIEKYGLASSSNIYIDSGKIGIKDNKTVMFYAGVYYAEELKRIAPDMAGQWRMTALPFGINALSYQDLIAVSSRSTNKSAAWAVAQLLTENQRTSVERLKSMQLHPELDPGDPYFGGQKTGLLQYRLLDQVPEGKLTPIDEESNQILWQTWNEHFYEHSLSAQDLAHAIEQDITSGLEQEIQSLKDILADP
ncbi:ABC transporter substrate-binding protein [Paenibacillus ihuae]|uniref:ABC transporter substrate-binding protein n=1 Tax=Paenibacillus ihuae TaxID=1232431 RepID=UPI0006D56C3B|nr:extracellular solute-binding protein [Paenibacillus ihuae]